MKDIKEFVAVVKDTDRNWKKGNLIGKSQKKVSVLQKLNEGCNFLSTGGLYFDRYMKEVTLKRLRAVFKKKEFKKLQIIGQFNLGFIVCTLNGTDTGDLFILD